jgi:hypothetical protein
MLGAYKLVMDAAEQYVGFAPEDLAKIKELRQREYRSSGPTGRPYRAYRPTGSYLGGTCHHLSNTQCVRWICDDSP